MTWVPPRTKLTQSNAANEVSGAAMKETPCFRAGFCRYLKFQQFPDDRKMMIVVFGDEI
jgi:hypothetical protein